MKCFDVLAHVEYMSWQHIAGVKEMLIGRKLLGHKCTAQGQDTTSQVLDPDQTNGCRAGERPTALRRWEYRRGLVVLFNSVVPAEFGSLLVAPSTRSS